MGRMASVEAAKSEIASHGMFPYESIGNNADETYLLDRSPFERVLLVQPDGEGDASVYCPPESRKVLGSNPFPLLTQRWISPPYWQINLGSRPCSSLTTRPTSGPTVSPPWATRIPAFRTRRTRNKKGRANPTFLLSLYPVPVHPWSKHMRIQLGEHPWGISTADDMYVAGH